ncbi:hypothetical protein [Candidatus Methanodesulfokora washburnensis]|jgi:hypothetical protein|uniref:Uncharacterized protein n=1 Tax=Candidatus Methanodesulfokora washburnensis TaxID=2478471 RepID=A0A429GBQ7_9CREN|nr:hypothetical protein [Candidatus Methanodesulfokores washburnensis]RSN71260.1 hypothetical protein D6D85_16275 [Candidatus Methanodesulfokores washburnensis]
MTDENMKTPVSVSDLEEPEGAMKPSESRRGRIRKGQKVAHTLIYIRMPVKQALDELKPKIAEITGQFPPDQITYTEEIGFLIKYFKDREMKGGM